MTVVLLEIAQLELDEAIDWYAQQAPGLGDALLAEIIRAFKLIAQFPLAWLALGSNTRKCKVNLFPYSVIYSVDESDLIVIAIAHQHRKPDYWQSRLAPGTRT